MENKLLKKVGVENHYKIINKRIQEKRDEYSRLKDRLNKAVMNGDGVDHITSQLASLDHELQALGEAMSDLESDRNEYKDFLNSKEADKLRKRLSDLEDDHEKLYKAVRDGVNELRASLDALFEALVEYDDVRKSLGQGNYTILGFSSIKRKKPYSYLINLKNSIDEWLRGARSLGID